MFQSHGIGYEEYCLDFDCRMEVEKSRQENYQQEKTLLLKLSKNLT